MRRKDENGKDGEKEFLMLFDDVLQGILHLNPLVASKPYMYVLKRHKLSMSLVNKYKRELTS